MQKQNPASHANAEVQVSQFCFCVRHGKPSSSFGGRRKSRSIYPRDVRSTKHFVVAWCRGNMCLQVSTQPHKLHLVNFLRSGRGRIGPLMLNFFNFKVRSRMFSKCCVWLVSVFRLRNQAKSVRGVSQIIFLEGPQPNQIFIQFLFKKLV